ncbi:hypothetical protein NIES2100_01820 [Calothrix sp. NIES-2100]|nr:hypothetical protein NIES2100_01820 [Calothrix sp. NIES-2100]
MGHWAWGIGQKSFLPTLPHAPASSLGGLGIEVKHLPGSISTDGTPKQVGN